MKKVVSKSFVLGLFLLSTILSAQVRLGIKGAIQRTNVSVVHSESKGRTAGAIGAFVQIPLGYENQFFFQPEVEYSLQGESDDLAGTISKVKYFQNYINVPLLFRAYLSEDESEFFVDLGPQVSFLVHQKNKEKDLQNYSKIEDLDFSILGGIGFSLNRSFDISIRYNYGLVDAYKNYPRQNRTSKLALTLAYTFN